MGFFRIGNFFKSHILNKFNVADWVFCIFLMILFFY